MAERVVDEFMQQYPDRAESVKWRGPQNPESGYSSIHVIFSLPVQIELEDGPQEVETSIEVQIRDVFEDGWGELSHRLGYKRSDKGLSDKRELDRQLKTARFRELNALKASADAVSQHATLLDRSLSYFVYSAGFSGTQQSVSNIVEDLDAILGIIPADRAKHRALVADAYHLMEAAHEASVRELDDAAPCEYYQSAANLFGELIDLLPDDIKDSRLPGKTGMPVNYHLQLERANALVMSVDPNVSLRDDKQAKELLDTAIGFYESLRATPRMLEEYARDATIHLRLGQALARAAIDADERKHAIDTLSEAKKLSLYDPQIARLARDHWLKLQAEYEIAKASLKDADLSRNTRIENLEEALNISDEAVATADEFVIRNIAHAHIAHKIINNTLYYRLIYAGALKNQRRTIDEDERQKIERHFEALLHRPYKRFVETHTKTIDTLLRAALFLDQREIALDMAERNVTKLRQVARARLERKNLTSVSDSARVSQVLDPIQYKLYKLAMKVSHPLDDIEEYDVG